MTSVKGHIIYPGPLLLLAIRNKYVWKAGEHPIQFETNGCLSAIGRSVWIIDGVAYAPVCSDGCELPLQSRSGIHQWLIIMCAFTARSLTLMHRFILCILIAIPAHGLPVIFKWFLITDVHSLSLLLWLTGMIMEWWQLCSYTPGFWDLEEKDRWWS